MGLGTNWKSHSSKLQKIYWTQWLHSRKISGLSLIARFRKKNGPTRTEMVTFWVLEKRNNRYTKKI